MARALSQLSPVEHLLVLSLRRCARWRDCAGAAQAAFEGFFGGARGAAAMAAFLQLVAALGQEGRRMSVAWAGAETLTADEAALLALVHAAQQDGAALQRLCRAERSGPAACQLGAAAAALGEVLADAGAHLPGPAPRPLAIAAE